MLLAHFFLSAQPLHRSSSIFVIRVSASIAVCSAVTYSLFIDLGHFFCLLHLSLCHPYKQCFFFVCSAVAYVYRHSIFVIQARFFFCAPPPQVDRASGGVGIFPQCVQETRKRKAAFGVPKRELLEVCRGEDELVGNSDESSGAFVCFRDLLALCLSVYLSVSLPYLSCSCRFVSFVFSSQSL